MKRLSILIALLFPALCSALSYECYGLAGAIHKPERTFVLTGYGENDVGFVYSAEYRKTPSGLKFCTAVRSCNIDRDAECWNVSTKVACSRENKEEPSVIYATVAYDQATRENFKKFSL